MKRMLLIVDPQNDFITGSLTVPNAKEAMSKLADFISKRGVEYDVISVTLDSHPENHCSFIENGGIWPKHCILHTNGWGFPEYLDDAIKELNQIKSDIAFHLYLKGTECDKEEYSIFDNAKDGNLLKKDIQRYLQNDSDVYIDVCGIAGDYCVLETLKGLKDIVDVSQITILEPYTASIDGGNALKSFAEENKIKIIEQIS